MPKKPNFTLAKGLHALDIFEEPIRLNMEGNESLKSSLGGTLTLIIVGFLLSQFIIQTIDMVERKNPAILQENEYHDKPPRVYLNRSNNFVFAIAASLDGQFLNMSADSPLSFAATYNQLLRYSDGSVLKNKAKVYWRPCTQDNFPANVFSSDTFSRYSLKYAYCPTEIDFTNSSGLCPEEMEPSTTNCKTPIDLSLEGGFLSTDFEYLQFQVNLCNSDDITAIQGLKCTSQDKVAILNSSEVSFNIFFSNNIINTVNFGTPNKTYLDTLFWNLSPSIPQFADIFVDSVTVQDYSNYFSSDVYQNRTFYQISSDKLRDMQIFKQSSLMKLNMRRSTQEIVIIRKYTKILDIISNIGGISKALLVIGAAFVIGYTRYKSQILLSNSLYDFDTSEIEKVQKKKGSYKDDSRAKKLQKKKNLSNILSENMLKNKKQEVLGDSIKKYFETHRKEARTLKIGEIEYIKSVINMLICKRTPKERLAEKARQQINKDLDIIKIVGKLSEIDKLKRLLLNKDQREAFNFIEKPLVTLKDEEPIHISLENLDDAITPKQSHQDKFTLSEKAEHSSISKYSKLYLAYTRLKQDNDPRNWKYNKKLLNMMGEDLKEIFQRVDNVMEGDPTPKKFEEIVQKIVKESHLELYLSA